MAERILVVEDEARIASFISRGLRLEGYQVDVAPDGETALPLPGLGRLLETLPAA